MWSELGRRGRVWEMTVPAVKVGGLELGLGVDPQNIMPEKILGKSLIRAGPPSRRTGWGNGLCWARGQGAPWRSRTALPSACKASGMVVPEPPGRT